MAPLKYLAIAVMFSVSTAAPLVERARPRLPREILPDNALDILPSEVTDPVSEVVDTLPVDVSVSAPVLPEKRKAEAAVEVDLGGGGLSVKREPEAAVEVDLGGGGLSV